MEKSPDEATPKRSAGMIGQMEKAERESKDPAEKERLAWIVSRFRSALVGSFVKRSQDSAETGKKDGK